jgi:hypothetical protein
MIAMAIGIAMDDAIDAMRWSLVSRSLSMPNPISAERKLSAPETGREVCQFKATNNRSINALVEIFA